MNATYNDATSARLSLAFQQVPWHKQGRLKEVVVAYQWKGLQAAREELRCWSDEVRVQVAKGTGYYDFDEAVCKCFDLILKEAGTPEAEQFGNQAKQKLGWPV